MSCFIKPDMHHTCLCIMPCLCGGCLLCRLLLRVGSGIVAFVRTRSSTSICLLLGLVLLPCGISGKMTIPSKSLLSFLASCSLFLLCLCCDTYQLLIMPHILLNQASNPPCPSKPLFGYVTALLSPSYSVVSCRWRLVFVPCWNMDCCWDITISLIILMHLYTG